MFKIRAILGLFLVGSVGLALAQTTSSGPAPNPTPAIGAILSAFDRYEIVVLPAAHGQKDLDDFILTLIRDPHFPSIVNDIAVECGNSIYQPVLDRYIAGDDISFAEVSNVWRNTTQPPCGTSGFYETLFPLVRGINQQLPSGRRLRVLAGDSPIDWGKIKTPQDFQNALRTVRRDTTMSNVIEKEVLAKHRKALMLFGLFHVLHLGAGFQKDYPGVTFVVAGMSTLGRGPSADRFAGWPAPSLVLAKGTWLGALKLDDLYPAPFMVDQDCHPAHAFPKPMQKPMEELVDAFLYLGSPTLSLTEKIPADIVLDSAYMNERKRRQSIMQSAGAAIENDDLHAQILTDAANPVYVENPPPQPNEAEIQQAVRMCNEWKNQPTKPR